MPNTIILKKSSTASSVPSAASLQPGELAVNLADKKLYSKTVGGTVILLADGNASAASGTVTSVNVSGGTTGLSFSGGPVTTNGTITAGGTLALANGGTGATTAAGARTNLDVPSTGGSGATGTWGISISGSAGSLSNVTGYMVGRGNVAVADINTATSNGFYSQINAGDSSGVLVFNPAGSLGPLQMRFAYQGSMEFRNQTDSATWTSWKTVLTSQNFNSYSPTLTGTGASGTWNISITGNALTATSATGLATGRTISLTGDVTGTSAAFNGTANLSFAATLANSGVTAGTYTKVTVDAKGRVTTGAALASADLPTYTGTISSSQVTTALGFTPYNATNPNGYTSNTGTVTSVAISGGTTGLTATGGPITTSGTITLGGTLGVANGGTGTASLTANAVILGNGTSAVQSVAPGASGNVLTSNGTTWVSQAAAGGVVAYPQNIQSGNYTLVLSDAGKHIYSANTAAQTITIPTNASVAFPIGTLVTIVNMGTSFIRLSTTGVSIYNNGSTTAMSTPIIAIGASVQLVKTGTNTWNALFGAIAEPALSYLVVAGGGAGGSGGIGSAGGGAGGMRTGTSNIVAGTFTVTVGAGGTSSFGQSGGNGSNSVFGAITSTGGGGGAGTNGTGPGFGGGSGGGGTFSSGAGGTGIAGQGNNGGAGSPTNYAGGGGGGAGAVGGSAVGVTPGNGGDGLASSVTGSSVFYAGGGGGAGNTAGAGGNGGGGAGVAFSGNGVAGTANRGGGGGGGGWSPQGFGGNGGSGIVIIAAQTPATSTTGSPTVTSANGNTIYTFTSSGTITW